jgi:adenine-specific DNA-methyltransferase
MSSDLEIVLEADGVGSSTLEKIREAGYENAEEMGEKSPAELAEDIDGVGFTTAVNILKVLEANNLRQRDPEEDNLYQLIELLEDLFYFDKEDQDFGVPKLMNQRRERLEQFIDEDLIETVHASIEEMEQNISESELEEAREEVINEINEDAIKPNGEVAEEYKDSDISSVREVVENYQEKKEQAEEVEERENARAEVYNHIYQFFNRYYDKGDFITQRYRTQHEPPYSVPYDGSNTNFHWVTKNQYYAKTSEYLTRFSFHIGNWRYCFVTEDTEKEDTIGDNEYFVIDPDFEIEEDKNKVIINFERRGIDENDVEKHNISGQNKQEELNESALEIINSNIADEISFDREFLENKLHEYTFRNQNDFFIHKNLESFLRSELEEYIKTNIVRFDASSGVKGFDSLNLEKSKAVNEVCIKIIEFLTQIERFKKDIFEKKKFVYKGDYLIPLSKIGESAQELVLEDEQINRWKDLNLIDQSNDDLNLDSLPKNRLMVNTELFSAENKRKILSNSDLSNKDLIINGENYQGIELSKNRYKESLKAIYIDPPYNTKDDTPFPYKDDYQTPTWLSMLYDRLEKAKEMLSEEGLVFVSIDDREVDNLRLMMDEVFGRDNFIAQATVVNKLKGSQDKEGLAKTHDYLLIYARDSKKADIHQIPLKDWEMDDWEKDDLGYYKEGANLKATGRNAPRTERPNLFYPIYIGENGEVRTKEVTGEEEVIYPRTEDEDMSWRWSKEKVENEPYNIIVKETRNGISLYKKQRPKKGDIPTKKAKTMMYKPEYSNGAATRTLKGLFGDRSFETAKPVELIKDILRLTIEDGDTVADFFAGSGTTAQAVMELRKERNIDLNYILAEINEPNYELEKKRVEKLAYSKDWKSGNPEVPKDSSLESFDENSTNTTPVQFLKIENYEDALDSVDFGEEQSGLSQHTDYLLNYMLDFETVSASLMKTGVDRENDIFSKPLEYKLNRDAQKDTTADLMTTFNYLLGLREVEYEQTQIDGVDYSVYSGVMGEDDVLIIWRHDASEVEDYDTEREEFDVEEYDHIYVNGDSAISGAKLISSAFKRKMFGGE